MHLHPGPTVQAVHNAYLGCQLPFSRGAFVKLRKLFGLLMFVG